MKDSSWLLMVASLNLFLTSACGFESRVAPEATANTAIVAAELDPPVIITIIPVPEEQECVPPAEDVDVDVTCYYYAPNPSLDTVSVTADCSADRTTVNCSAYVDCDNQLLTRLIPDTCNVQTPGGRTWGIFDACPTPQPTENVQTWSYTATGNECQSSDATLAANCQWAFNNVLTNDQRRDFCPSFTETVSGQCCSMDDVDDSLDDISRQVDEL